MKMQIKVFKNKSAVRVYNDIRTKSLYKTKDTHFS